MWGRTWREAALDLLLPRTCASCEEDLPPPLTGPLCGLCLRGLRPLSPEDVTEADGLSVLSAAYAYQVPLPGMIHAFKYGGRTDIGRSLADWMAGLWPRKCELGRPHALIPVPLSPRRERYRGFNQAQVLTESITRTARVPILRALVRIRNTPPQRGLSREKRLNQLRGVFAVRSGLDLRGSRLVLIDDVYTTGGTLGECARMLREAGAQDVRAYVLAKKF